MTHTTLTTGRGTTGERLYDITSPQPAKSDFLQSIAVEGEGYFADSTHAVAHNHTIPGTIRPIETTSTITVDDAPPKEPATDHLSLTRVVR